jgi:membrane protease YdiL (CAAX protease family)
MLPCHIYMVYPDPLPPAFISPADTLTAGQKRLIAVAEVVLCSSLPTQIVIGQLLATAGLNPRGDNGQLSPPFAFALLLLDSIVLIAIMVVLTRAHRESVRELWLGNRPVLAEFWRGLALVPAVFLIVGLVLTGLMRVLPGLHNVTDNPIEQLASGGPHDAAMLGMIAVLAGGVREELQRAFLLRRFEQHLGGPFVGVLVLSAAFGLGHYPQGWDAVIATGLLGAIWAVVYLRRRSSVAPIVSHAGFNSLEVLRVALLGSPT